MTYSFVMSKKYKTNANKMQKANTFKQKLLYKCKKSFCNLARDLVAKLPPPSKRFGLGTVRNYYQDILGLLPLKFKFSNVTEDLSYSY